MHFKPSVIREKGSGMFAVVSFYSPSSYIRDGKNQQGGTLSPFSPSSLSNFYNSYLDLICRLSSFALSASALGSKLDPAERTLTKAVLEWKREWRRALEEQYGGFMVHASVHPQETEEHEAVVRLHVLPSFRGDGPSACGGTVRSECVQTVHCGRIG